MKIALHAAKGLEYLHHKANPPVIYRDLKSSNVLLDKEYNAKLSDFGLAKVGPTGDNTHVSSRVMGTYGYCAPEYQQTGKLTIKSDVYSFGVVLLELITGKRAVDITRFGHQQNLVTWVSETILLSFCFGLNEYFHDETFAIEYYMIQHQWFLPSQIAEIYASFIFKMLLPG